jgi:hypothetical protein
MKHTVIHMSSVCVAWGAASGRWAGMTAGLNLRLL